MGRYIRGGISDELLLPTIAARALIKGNLSEVVTERAWLSSVVARYALQNFTQGADDGPIMVGFAHSDYAAAEIEQWVENLDSWKEADLIGREIGRRKIRRVGIFTNPGSVNDASVLNDGKAIRVKAGWMLTTGQTIAMWAYNLGDSAIATTVPEILTEGHANLWPR